MTHLSATSNEAENVPAGPVSLDGNIPHANLSDVVQLLQEYSPVWFTEEHHRRVEFAIAVLQPIFGANHKSEALAPASLR
jgi:hypothetical protein